MNSDHIRSSFEAAVEYLTENPAEARYTDSAAIATVDGLKAEVRGPGENEHVVTDMPTGIGGGDSAPSPGWLLRAAVASCEATLISLRAAQQGIELADLEVAVDSESDDRGILGLDQSIPSGPLQMRISVSISAPGVKAGRLRDLVAWGHAHCPVTDAVRRDIETELVIEVIETG